MPGSTNELKKFLSSNVCKEAGIVSLSVDQEEVLLGAMNPIYKNVQNIIKSLENNYTVNVQVKQISPEEFEKWDENSNPISFQDSKQSSEVNKLAKEVKNDNTPVTNGDLEVNEILTNKIKELTPNIPIVSEESSLNKENGKFLSVSTYFKCKNKSKEN